MGDIYKEDQVLLYCDNQSALNISEGTIGKKRSKHIDLRYHFIKDLIEKSIIRLEYIASEVMVADILTKPIDADKNNRHARSIGLSDLSESAANGKQVLICDIGLSGGVKNNKACASQATNKV